MNNTKLGNFFFGLFLIFSTVLLIYGVRLICIANIEERKERDDRLYKEGYAAGEIELNPLLSPYTEWSHYNSVWKRGYADAIIKKKQKAEYER